MSHRNETEIRYLTAINRFLILLIAFALLVAFFCLQSGCSAEVHQRQVHRCIGDRPEVCTKTSVRARGNICSCRVSNNMKLEWKLYGRTKSQ